MSYTSFHVLHFSDEQCLRVLRDGVLSQGRFDGLLKRRQVQEAPNSFEFSQDVVRSDGRERQLSSSKQASPQVNRLVNQPLAIIDDRLFQSDDILTCFLKKYQA